MPNPEAPGAAPPDDAPGPGPASPASVHMTSVPSTPREPAGQAPASPASDSAASPAPLPPPPQPLEQPPRRATSHRAVSDPQTSTVLPAAVPATAAAAAASSYSFMNASSTVSGTLHEARRPPPSASNLPADLMQKARALQQKRMAMSPHHPGMGPQQGVGGPAMGGSPGGMGPLAGGMSSRMNPAMNLGGLVRPAPPGFHQSAPAVPSLAGRPGGPSLSERRAMKMGQLPGGAGGLAGGGRPPKLSDLGGGGSGGPGSSGPAGGGSPGGMPGRPQFKAGGRHDSRINDFRHYIDAERGWITFEGAATITRTGVNFAGGHTFKISLDEIQVLEELGKGNYGTVFKVRHARPAVPRFGPGLSGFKAPPYGSASAASQLPALSNGSSGAASTATGAAEPATSSSASSAAAGGGGGGGGGGGAGDGGSATGNKPLATGTTGKVMAMKEIRLELDEAKFSTILKELVILHECVSPYIIDFYGAFFQEGAVYMCIEFMDGGSIDKLYAGGIPEAVLRKITFSTVMGLKTLKDDHNIIHRDVKPTNILANSAGQVKICDFGVSGNLVASIAKTNIGCQSYMAPERISGGGGMAQGANAEGTYSVQSDIWSLGLTIIECAMGRYPYPPEVSSTIFSQLSAIVNGEPPDMPDGYSATARDFVRSCLNKNPMKRSTYSMLLNHAWLKPLVQAATMIEEEDEATDSDSDSDSDADTEAGAAGSAGAAPAAGDAEVAAWVTEVLMQKQSGHVEAAHAGSRPALHAAPLAA